MERRRIRCGSLAGALNWGVTPCEPKMETAGLFRKVGVLLWNHTASSQRAVVLKVYYIG